MDNMKNKNDKRGFTIIELIISIAIFGLIMTMVFSFMVAASRSYQKSSTEISVQNEVQTLTTQLQNLIAGTGTNVGVDGDMIYLIEDEEFEVIQYDSANEYLYYYDNEQLGLTSSSTEMLEYIALESRDDKLSKAKSIVSAHAITNISDQLESYLMSEYVTEFTVEAYTEKSYVVIHLTLEKDDVSYSAAKNIYLRNKLYDTSETTTTAAATASTSE